MVYYLLHPPDLLVAHTKESTMRVIKQHLIGEELYNIWRRTGSRSLLPTPNPERFLPRRERSRYWYERKVTGLGTFPSRLASYAAQLEYEGKTLFAIMTGSYHEGDYDGGYHWSGAMHPGQAHVIRTAADYAEAEDYYFGKDSWYEFDWDTSYHLAYVAAPTSIIVAQATEVIVEK